MVGSRLLTKLITEKVASLNSSRNLKYLSTKEIVNKSNKYLLGVYKKPDLVLSHGKGSLVYDLDGKEYLDMCAGIAVVGLGHSDDGIVKVLTEQSAKLVASSNLFHNEPGAQLAEKLVTTASPKDGLKWAGKVFLCNSGTEANEAALKFGRKVGSLIDNNKNQLVSFKGAFHGRSMGALSVTPNPKYQKPFLPLIPNVNHLPFNCSNEELIQNITSQTAAVIIEPIQGEGGINVSTQQFLKSLRDRCTEMGAVLIFDEIQCGLGRTGKVWAHHHYGVNPDILTLAKPLGNGYPIGAVIVSDDIAKKIEVGDHGTTFGGSPLSSAVGSYVIDRITQPTMLEHVNNIGAKLHQGLINLQSKYPKIIKEVRGKGLILGMQLNSDYEASKVCDQARDNGVLLITCGTNTLRMVPPLIINQHQIDTFLKVIKTIFDKMD